MRAVSFAYWLQGYFEIQGKDENLSMEQARKIFKKAESVKAGTDAVEQSAKGSVEFIKGLLVLAVQTNDANALAFATKQIRDNLNNLFIHSVDPSYEGDQTNFNNIHGNKPPGSGFNQQPGVRC